MNWKLIRIIDTCLGIPLLLLAFIVGRFRANKSFPNRAGVKRILFVKFWGIGNIFMILPSVQAMRAAYPNVTFDFLTLSGNRDALAATGLVDSIITIDTGGIVRFLGTWFRAVSLLKQNNYNITIDFEQFARFSALVAYQTGAREIIGFDTCGQFRSILYTRKVPYDNTVPVTRSFYALAVSAGAEPAPFLPAVRLAGLEKMRLQGNELLSSFGFRPGELCVVMHIGTSNNFRERRWLPERYAELADRFVEVFQVRVVFTGLAEESFLIRDAIEHVRFRASVIDLGGRLNFADFFALISAADLVISADTAAVHIASAIDVPTVGLYGPNTPDLYGPWGTKGLAIYQRFDCSPCITNFNAKLHTCRHPEGRGACMQAIEVADTFLKIKERYFAPGASCMLERLAGR